jgi:hypothetical protein
MPSPMTSAALSVARTPISTFPIRIEQAHVGDGMLLVAGGERGIGGARSATAGLRGGNRRSHVVRGNETLACGE